VQDWYRLIYIDSGSATVKGDSAAPRKDRKTTNLVPNQTKPKRRCSRRSRFSRNLRNQCGGTKNKFAYKPKSQSPRQSLTSCIVLRSNNSGKVVTKLIGHESNVYKHASIWVPKFLVTNLQGPKSSWGPNSSS
jgi:hypothetical protein